MRIVLDANIFVSAAITPSGACGKILQSVLANPDEFELILTQQIIDETVATLSKPRVVRYLKHNTSNSRMWMEDIASISTMVPDIPISLDECRDPDDVVYLAAADIAKARFIISGDKDLTVLKQYRDVDIVSPSEFIFIIQQILSR